MMQGLKHSAGHLLVFEWCDVWFAMGPAWGVRCRMYSVQQIVPLKPYSNRPVYLVLGIIQLTESLDVEKLAYSS